MGDEPRDEGSHQTETEMKRLRDRVNQDRRDASFERTKEKIMASLDNPKVSVLQDWVVQLPLREQGTLLTAVRGCDDEPKMWIARGVAESPGRRITAWVRWCFMNPADPREVDVPGAFFQSRPPFPFKPSGFGHLPQHWYSHIMHGLEVIAYRHPHEDIRMTAFGLYQQMVWNMHLNVETMQQFNTRLSEDRIASGEVVS
jgi:hypothetical protein